MKVARLVNEFCSVRVGVFARVNVHYLESGIEHVRFKHGKDEQYRARPVKIACSFINNYIIVANLIPANSNFNAENIY